MTWRETQALLDAEIKTLQDGVPNLHELASPREAIPDALLELEEAESETVDSAVRTFCGTRQWPELSLAARTLLVLRLEYAAGLCFLFSLKPQDRNLQIVPDPSMDTPEEYVLMWLLTTAWHNEGFASLHNTSERILLERTASTPQRNS